MKRLIFALALALASLVSIGSATAQSSDKKSDGDFTGLALITDDPNWFALFQRPETPNISLRNVLGAGDSAALALIFSNAEPLDGVIRVVCDVTAFDPKGSQVLVESGPCYEGPSIGPNILVPALLNISFSIAPDDPDGEAGFEITMRDVNSGRSVNLNVTFTQGGAP